MAKIITVCNVKGGTAKSISALFMASILADAGRRVLLIDLDSQNSLTSFFVEDYSSIEGRTIYEALLGKVDLRDTITSAGKRLDFIPADIGLSNLTLQLTEGRDFRLYSILEPIKKEYDFIILDCPPSLHLESKLALAVSNYIIIPTIPEAWAARSINIVLDYVQNKNMPLQDIIKAKLEGVYILPVMREKGRTMQGIILEDLRIKYHSMVLEGITRRADIQKLSYIGQGAAKLPGLEAWGEYLEALKTILGPKIFKGGRVSGLKRRAKKKTSRK